MKHLLKRSDDPYVVLLSYRATPLSWCNLSPSELLMGRRLRTSLPQNTKHLFPRWPYLPEFKRSDKQYKNKTKEDFHRRHRVCDLPKILHDQDVWVSSDGTSVPGSVVSPARSPRSCIIRTPSGVQSMPKKSLSFSAFNSLTDLESWPWHDASWFAWHTLVGYNG